MSRLKLPEPEVSPRAMPTPYGSGRTDLGAGELQQGFRQAASQINAGAQQFAAAAAEHEREAAKAKHDADRVKVGDSLTALRKRGTDELYGAEQPDPDFAAEAAFEERDPREGYLTTRGARAAEAGTTTFERLEKKRQELLESLANDDQKQLFKELSDRELEQYYGQIERHTAQERERQKIDTLNHAEEQAARAAVMDPANDELATRSIASVVGLQDSFTTSTGDALAKADAVQGRITSARLDALLATPDGFTDAERVLEQNKGALGLKYDEYRKRVDAAKLGGQAVVEANRIVERAMPKEGSRQQFLFRMPDDEQAFLELAKLPPKLQERVAPLLAQRMAMRKAAIKEQRDAFIDTAVARYNTHKGTFFGSDVANRLNQVDPDKYRALWNESFVRWRAAGDDSAKARREQAERDRLALLRYQNHGDGDVDARLKLNPETFVAGMGVSPEGLERIKKAHAEDNAKKTKGLAQSETSFVHEVKGALQKFAPPPGTTPAARARAKAWWDKKVADAITGFNSFGDKPPTKADLEKVKASIIADTPIDPLRPDQVQANVEAIGTLAGKARRTGNTKTVGNKRYHELTDGGVEVEELGGP